jgi:hypothetical protein
MHMTMLMPFRKVQPDPNRHQKSGDGIVTGLPRKMIPNAAPKNGAVEK